MTLSELFTAVADLLEKPGAWTQGTWARTKTGHQTIWDDRKAVCWCLEGALRKIVPVSTLRSDARKAFRLKNLINWNDHPSRTQSEVVALCRKLAVETEGRG